MQLNKKNALEIIGNFALEAALKILESNEDFKVELNRKVTLDGFLSFLNNEGIDDNESVGECIARWLTAKEFFEYEDSERRSARKRAEDEKIRELINARFHLNG